MEDYLRYQIRLVRMEDDGTETLVDIAFPLDIGPGDDDDYSSYDEWVEQTIEWDKEHGDAYRAKVASY